MDGARLGRLVGLHVGVPLLDTIVGARLGLLGTIVGARLGSLVGTMVGCNDGSFVDGANDG